MPLHVCFRKTALEATCRTDWRREARLETRGEQAGAAAQQRGNENLGEKGMDGGGGPTAGVKRETRHIPRSGYT